MVVELNAPYGFFTALAATAPMVPSDPNTFSDDALVFFPETVDGIGPYRMVSYNAGEQMVLAFDVTPPSTTVLL